MEEEMKGFWKFFAILMVGAAINLAGGILGKTLVGYLLFALGLVVILAVFVYLFIKTSYFKGDRLKVLILALFMSVLLASSAVLLISSGSSRFRAAGSNSLLSGATGSFTRGATGGFTGGGNFTRSGGSTSGGFSSGFGGNSNFTPNGTGTSSSTTGTSSNFSNYASAAAARSLVSKILGWLFLVAGAILLLITGIRLLTKKVTYTGGRLKVLILGLLIGAMLASSSTLLLTRQTRRFPGNFTGAPTGLTGVSNGAQTAGQTTGQTGTSAAVATTVAPTATETPMPTLNPTDVAATATAIAPQPTNTPTPVTVSDLVVCLDYNRQVGEDIRVFPSLTSVSVGVIPAAACFTIDGKTSQYPGWYHLEKGQNGMGGIQFSADENTRQLWVNGTHFMKTAVDLSELPELAVKK